MLRLRALASPLFAEEDVARVEQWRVHEGDDPRWAAPDFDDSGWQPSNWLRRFSSAQAFFAGTRWYRASVSLPPSLAGQPLAIAMPPLDEVYDVFVNGVRIAKPGFAVESAYLPASEVGGDSYQKLTSSGGALLVLVGEVSGKGLRAALLVGHISGALSNERSYQPAEVLANLNQSLVGRVRGGLAPCCYARFDPDGKVTIANAGHPAPYDDGRELEVATGLPLGVAAGVTYDESIATGEAEPAQRELFGFDRTRDISTHSAQEIARAAKAWGQNDDITVVTVRRNA
ncbi:MAG: PP2C family protein-serine/threonine phosphatase [Bryobacteraceae bacterium]